MAIVQTGSVLQFPAPGNANTGTVSTTITVPADAELVVVGWSGFTNTSGFFSGGGMTFTKGGVDTVMTSVTGGDLAGSNWAAGYFYQVLPDTGSNKTLKWDWSGTATDDGGVGQQLCSVTFWKGIDTASPTRGSSAGQGGSNTPYTTGTITAISGDLIIAWVAGFVNNVEGTIDSWSNLTLLSQITHSNQADGAWATGSPSGDTTVAASTDTNFDDGSIVAVAFKAAAAAVAVAPFNLPLTLKYFVPKGPFQKVSHTKLGLSIDSGVVDNPEFPLQGNLVLSSAAPTVFVSNNTNIIPPQGNLTLTALMFEAKSVQITGDGVTSLSDTSLTVGIDANRALAVLISISGNNTSFTVTWGGTPLTQVAAVTNGFDESTAIYGLLNPASGNQTLAISWSGTQSVCAAGVSLTGVEQSSLAAAFTNANNSTGSTSPATVTISSAVGDMVMACQAAVFCTLTEDNISIYNYTALAGTGLSANRATGAASVTLAATESVNQTWATSGINVHAKKSANAPMVSVGINITVPQGNLVLSPTAETVVQNINRVPLQGNLVLSPTAETVVQNINRVPPQGNLVLSPTAETVAVSNNVSIVPPQGNLVLSPTAETVAVSNNVSIVPPQGNLVLSPTAETVTLSNNINLVVPQGNLVLSEVAPSVSSKLEIQIGFSQGFLFHPGRGPSWDIKRRAAFPADIITASYNIVSPQGNLVLSPTVPARVIGFNIVSPQGNLILSPTAETVAVSNNISIVPPQGNLVLSPTAETVVQNINRVPAQGNLALSEVAPTVAIVIAAFPVAGNLVLSPTAPTVAQTFNVSLMPLQGNLVLSEVTPSATVSNNINRIPLQGNLALSPTAETVLVSDNRAPLPVAGNVVLSGTAPTVAQTLHRNIVVPQGNIVLSGTAPSAGGSINRNPLQGNAVLSPTAPIVAWTDNRTISPPAGNLQLSPTAPTSFASVHHPITIAQGNLILSTLPAQLIPGVYEYPPQTNLVLSTSAPIVVKEKLHHWRAVNNLIGNVVNDASLKGDTTQDQSLKGG